MSEEETVQVPKNLWDEMIDVLQRMLRLLSEL
jgi:hypothetical protein